MLIIITKDELQKFPQGEYTQKEIPVLVTEPQYKFSRLAQNMQNHLICGLVSGDLEQFIASEIMYEEVADIPSRFEQRVLPPQYGIYLNQEQITTGLMLENKALIKQRADIDFIAVMADIDLGV